MLPADHPTLFDPRGIPSRWPTIDGMVSPTPAAWRFSVAELAAADLLYQDLLWAIQLELDHVQWPGRTRNRSTWSPIAAISDVAALWGLPSADLELPRESAQVFYRISSHRNQRPSRLRS